MSLLLVLVMLGAMFPMAASAERTETGSGRGLLQAVQGLAGQAAGTIGNLSNGLVTLLHLTNDVEIVAAGQPLAVVVTADVYDQAGQAASKLSEYVRKSTDALLPVLTETQLQQSGTQYDGYARIYVGPGAGVDSEFPDMAADLTGVGDDGFIIRSSADSVAIVGPTPWGTEFGVDEFLERYVGVRWLMPGPDGEDVPRSPDLAIPDDEDVRDEPYAISRQFSGLRGTAMEDWARDNRMHGTVQFHHNLNNLFPPDDYGKTHPEFYPLKNGEPSVPTTAYGWQPCFTVPATVTEAVYRINAYFDANPNATSYSLGVNDGSGFCEAQPSHPNYPNQFNSLGYVDMSDIYYEWVNEVVAGVLQQHPDKYFGLLAYREVFDPPSFPLNPRVIPYITDDRFAWADPVYEAEGKQAVEAWQGIATRLGFYDYLYGSYFAIPRVYMSQLGDVYAYAKQKGVSAHYAELYPNWGEGPKAWVSLKQQWNPDLNTEALEQEWYERAVGPAAAADLDQYYEHWEQFWTDRVFDSEWYADWMNNVPRATHSLQLSTRYLKDITDEEIADSRQLLESVVDKAVTPQQQARANLLLQAFEYYEASALSYPKDEPVAVPANETEALDLFDDAMVQVQMGEKRLQLAQQFSTDPVLQLPNNPPLTTNYESWSGMDGDKLSALVAWLKQEPANGAVRQQAALLAKGTDNRARYARLLLKLAGGQFSLAQNESFEAGNGTKATGWTFFVNQGVGTLERSQETVHSGSYAVKATGVSVAYPLQRVPFTHYGAYSASVYYYLPAGASTSGTIQIKVNLKDAAGANLLSLTSIPEPLQPTAGRWAWHEYRLNIPAVVNSKAVASADFVPYIVGLGAGQQLYLDEARLDYLDDWLSGAPAGPLAAGTPVTATSWRDGTLYLVPSGTPADAASIATAAAAANGRSAAVTAGVPGTLNTTGLATDLYKLYAIDEEGNVSPSPRAFAVLDTQLGSIEEGNAVVQYSGTWSVNTDSQHSGGTQRLATAQGAYAELPFYGKAATVVGTRNTNYGKARIYVDGAYQATIDAYGSSMQYRQDLYTTDLLPEGVHTIRIEADWTRNAASTNNYVPFDALRMLDESQYPFKVTGLAPGAFAVGDQVTAKSTRDGTLYLVPTSTAATRTAIEAAGASANGRSVGVTAWVYGTMDTTGLTEGLYKMYAIDASGNVSPGSPAFAILDPQAQDVDNTDPLIQYFGTWTLYSNTQHIGGSQRLGMSQGAFADIPFYGTAATLIGARNTVYGKARIYLDGVYQTTVDYYNPTVQFQQDIYSTGTLPEGPHLLRIEADWTKNSAAGNYFVSLDALAVTP